MNRLSDLYHQALADEQIAHAEALANARLEYAKLIVSKSLSATDKDVSQLRRLTETLGLTEADVDHDLAAGHTISSLCETLTLAIKGCSPLDPLTFGGHVRDLDGAIATAPRLRSAVPDFRNLNNVRRSQPAGVL